MAKEEQGNAVLAVHFTIKAVLTTCTLLTRWSASVLQLGVLCGLRSL